MDKINHKMTFISYLEERTDATLHTENVEHYDPLVVVEQRLADQIIFYKPSIGFTQKIIVACAN